MSSPRRTSTSSPENNSTNPSSSSTAASGSTVHHGNVPTVGSTIVPTPPPPSDAQQDVTPPTTMRQKGRSPRPQGFSIPPTGSPRQGQSPMTAGNSPLQGSSGYYRSATTPSGLEQHGYSPTFMSTTDVGPLSPGGPSSSNLNSNSFVFPMRSVFQGMGAGQTSPGEQTGSLNSGDGGGGSGSALRRVTSKGQGGTGGGSGGVGSANTAGSPGAGGGGISGTGANQQQAPRSSSARMDDRRFSQSFAAASQEDFSMASIAQMLQGQQDAEQNPIRPKPSGQTAVATFTGKVDRSAVGAGASGASGSGGAGGGTPSSGRSGNNNKNDTASPKQDSTSGVGNTPRGSPFGFSNTNAKDAATPSSRSTATIGHGHFFSESLGGGSESTESPFFRDNQDVRRASEGTEDSSHSLAISTSASQQRQRSPSRSRSGETPDRPHMPGQGENEEKNDSAATVTASTGRTPTPTNPSAEASGSGLPQKDRAPVGQPQDEPEGVNFRDRPGPQGDPGEKTSFSSAGRNEGGSKGPAKSTSRMRDQSEEEEAPARSAGNAGDSGSTTQIRAPQPRHSGPTGLAGLTQTTRPTAGTGGNSTSASAGSNRELSTFDEGEDGERQLVNDFSSIVRLAEAGSLTNSGGGGAGGSRDGAGTGTDSKLSKSHRPGRRGESSTDLSSGAGGGPSGPTTAARLAQQQREIGKSHAATRDSIQRFINDQAHTENMSDPNAATPSPAPDSSRIGTPRSTGGIDDDMDGNVKLGSQQDERDRHRSFALSDTGDSTRESSEVALVSGDESGDADVEDEGQDNAEPEPEPVVTLRFEHVATDDGHHVVVGREGKLRRCEDEPITTPGAVQGFGVLMVLEEDYEKGTMLVRQVSENATELLGLSPRYLFRLDCFTRILTDDQEDVLRDNLEYLPDGESSGTALEDEGPQVFLLSGFGEPGSNEEEDDDMSSAGMGRRREWTAWVGAHRPKQPTWNKVDEKGIAIPPPDLIVLEFELERDTYNPLMQTFEPTIMATSSGGMTPDSASDSMGQETDHSARSTVQSKGSSDTTAGTTPRPVDSPMSVGSMTDTIMRRNSKEGGSKQMSGSRPSSNLPKYMRPMGLEGVEVEMPLDRIIESTTNHAKPLRALERMRRAGGLDDESSRSGSGVGGSGRGSSIRGRGGRARRQRRQPQGSTGTMDVFAVLGQINDQLGSAPDLDSFLKIVVGVIQDVSRFHRVLLYQFDESFNGQVVAELVEWGKTTDLYKGLMFPAADIPAQARQLYKINKVRLLYDRSQTTARMCLRDKADLDHPLDMTHCFLRAMSPIHIKYLANMHVRSSMSVSIMAFGQLWGLIACHSYGHHGMRVSFPVRQMMRILSDSISRNIERLSYAQRLHTRKLISTIPSQSHPTGYIVSNADDLLQIFDADAGLLVIGSGCKLLGQSDQGQAMLAIAEYLRIVKFDTLKASNHLGRDFPDLALPRAPDTIAGLLYVPLTAKAGQDFIVFLRKGQAREVKWAGKPYKDAQAGEQASLEPRKSFKTWSEVVTGRSRAWSDDQLESAGVLALIYGKFIQVWREKQSAMASNQLTAILLSNTSHAVRTPLSQIINTLELALSGNIDDETRNMLENSHQASRALLFHVHDLLDLTRIETGNETSFNDPFDLRASIHDAVRLYQTESARRGLEFRVNIAPDVPQFVIGDSRKIKTVISNLVANSVKFTPNGWIEVYCGLQQADAVARPSTGSDLIREDTVTLEFIIGDSGVGIPNEKLQAMFVTLEGADEVKGDVAPTGLGLGLAVVARIVEQLEGQLRAESEEGVGSRFFFTLHMVRHDAAEISRGSSGGSAVARKKSSGSGSVASYGSGGSASEIDTFVHDFGASHMWPSLGPDDPRLREAEERMNKPGTFPVTDSSWPVRPSRVDTESEESQTPAPTGPSTSPRIGSGGHSRLPSSPRMLNPRRLTQLKGSGSLGSGSGSGSVTGSGSSSGLGPGSSPPAMTGAPGSNKSTGSATATATGDSDSAATPKSRHRPTQQSRKIDPSIPLRSKRGPDGSQRLRVLVVEDDTINAQILSRRLKMDKHSVILASNGQEGVDALKADWDIDAVLMDIQMPIMDGRTAAQEIRKLEDHGDMPDDIDPLRCDGRIPIFAVSASLYESDRSNLSEHFDGWLLKPLDFNRVRGILRGLEDDSKRSAEVYAQGHWERGGYFRAPPIDSPRV